MNKQLESNDPGSMGYVTMKICEWFSSINELNLSEQEWQDLFNDATFQKNVEIIAACNVGKINPQAKLDNLEHIYVPIAKILLEKFPNGEIIPALEEFSRRFTQLQEYSTEDLLSIFFAAIPQINQDCAEAVYKIMSFIFENSIVNANSELAQAFSNWHNWGQAQQADQSLRGCVNRNLYAATNQAFNIFAGAAAVATSLYSSVRGNQNNMEQGGSKKRKSRKSKKSKKARKSKRRRTHRRK